MTLDIPTRHQIPQPASKRLRAVAVSLVLAASLAATGCSLLPSGQAGADPASPAQAAPTQGAASSRAAAPAATAEPKHPASASQALAARVEASLAALGKTVSTPNRGQMMLAMVEAGADKEKVEVSVDKTPTGLAVDAMEAAISVAKECVIGQVRDGKAFVTVLPLLDTGRCFVGDPH